MAEIINTLTNITFLYLAGVGIHNCIKHGHDKVFLVSFLGYLLVGTGSTLFHTTLKYPMQLLDELSMIYTTCIMIYASFSPGRPRVFTISLAAALSGLCIFITLYYYYVRDPAFHQNAYTILTVIGLGRSMYLMETCLRPNRATAELEQKEQEIAYRSGGLKPTAMIEYHRRHKILHEMWMLIGCGLGIFVGGFGMWIIDNQLCSTLRVWRREMGMPWGMLLEGHGWW